MSTTRAAWIMRDSLEVDTTAPASVREDGDRQAVAPTNRCSLALNTWKPCPSELHRRLTAAQSRMSMEASIVQANAMQQSSESQMPLD